MSVPSKEKVSKSKEKVSKSKEKLPKSIEKLQLELKQTIDGLKCLEVVSASSRGGDIRVLCRCHDKPAWLRVLYQFLEQERDRSWYSFIGQKYMIWEGRLTAAWVLIFSSEDLDTSVQEVRKLLLSINAEIREKDPDNVNFRPGSVAVPLPSHSGFERQLQERTGVAGSRSAGDKNVRTVSFRDRSR